MAVRDRRICSVVTLKKTERFIMNAAYNSKISTYLSKMTTYHSKIATYRNSIDLHGLHNI